jgi:hypothetical protein
MARLGSRAILNVTRGVVRISSVAASVLITATLAMHRWLGATHWPWYYYTLAMGSVVVAGYFASRGTGARSPIYGWAFALCSLVAVLTPFLGMREVVAVPMTWSYDTKSGWYLRSVTKPEWRILDRDGSLDALYRGTNPKGVVVELQVRSSLGHRRWEGMLVNGKPIPWLRWRVSCDAEVHGQTNCPPF